MIEAPRHWRVAPLSDLLVPQPNGRLLQQGWSPRCIPSPSPTPDVWGVLKTTAIQAGWFDDTQNKELPVNLDPREAIEVAAGDLLMTCAGPRSRCGIPALVRQTRPRLMMSGKMYRFRPNSDLRSDFLEMWLLSDAAQERIDAMKTGISDSGLNLTHDRFLGLPVPVPPLDEQRRIVEILGDHLSRLDVARRTMDTAAARMDRWASAISDRLIWGQANPTRPLGSLLREPLRNGRSDRAVRDGHEGVRTLTLTAVTKDDFSDANTKVTSTSRQAARGLWLEPGDILVQRSNTPELVGTAARYNGPRDWAIFPDLLIRVRPDESVIEGRFMHAVLRSERSHRVLRAVAKGLSGSMPKIDQAAVASVPVPLPPLHEQSRLVAQLDEIEQSRGLSATAVAKQVRRSRALRRSLLAAAFAGRLTGSHTAHEVIAGTAQSLCRDLP